MTRTQRAMHSWRSVARVVVAAATLCFAQAVAAGETITYFHNDVIGSPVMATDVNGLQVWKETYRPYGDQLIDSAAAQNNKIWFAGKPFDDSTGLSYMGARYYDPTLGRFMGVDPVQLDPANLHTFNRYSYANNNPFKFYDPTGQEAACVSLNNCENVQLQEEAVNFTADLMPIVGDIKGIVEAVQEPSLLNIAAVGIGLIPGAGDVVSKGLKVGGEIAENAAKGAADLAADAARAASGDVPSRIYSARELIRRAEDPGPHHNFPESFNDSIFSGNRQVISNDYVLYTQRGSLNGASGTFEIGVRPSASGRTEVIVHRFFRSDKPR